MVGMAATGKIRKVAYICQTCKQQRNLTLDGDVHLKRRELTVNGLASYIDIHADSNGNRHASKLFIDPNFHVRTNNALKIKNNSSALGAGPAVPMPGLKTKSLMTKFDWDSWKELKLMLLDENLTFLLEPKNGETDTSGLTSITANSELGSVTCEVIPIPDHNSPEIEEFMRGWLTGLCNSIELASALHVDLIPEILRYIDHHVHRRITYNDEIIIGILVDKAAILIPDKSTMKMVAKYGPAMKLIGLDPIKLGKIAEKLCEQDQFSMVDIQKILESELEKGAELEEEFIVLALFYLISLDAFDYKLSYLSQTT